MSLTTPVEVSLWVTKTALMAGSAFSASVDVGRQPRASPTRTRGNRNRGRRPRERSRQRSPNLPQLAMSTLSPGEQRLTTADSMAPVPDAAKEMTSFCVW